MSWHWIFSLFWMFFTAFQAYSYEAIFAIESITPEERLARLKKLSSELGFPSIFARNEKGENLLHQLVLLGDIEFMRILLANHPLSTFPANSEGDAPVFYALYQDFADVLAFLEASGDNLQEIDSEGNTLLHQSILQGKRESFYFLLGKSPLLNVQNKQGDTPLHLALKLGKAEFVKALLTKGVSPLLQDEGGRKAVEYIQYFPVIEMDVRQQEYEKWMSEEGFPQEPEGKGITS